MVPATAYGLLRDKSRLGEKQPKVINSKSEGDYDKKRRRFYTEATQSRSKRTKVNQINYISVQRNTSDMSEIIFEKIASLLSSKKGVDKNSIQMSSSFDELGLDSLDAVELIADLEDEFNVTVPNMELQNIKTIQQAVDGLSKAMQQ